MTSRALALLLLVLGLSGCWRAAPTISPNPTVRPAPGNSALQWETRAVWSWAGIRAKSAADVDALVAAVDAGHLNVVLLLVYYNGTAYFEPSHTRFLDSRERLISQSPFVDTDHPDALSYLLAVRDRRRADSDLANDFEVHAWLAVNRGGDVGDGWPPADKNQPYMLNALFPEFQVKYGGYYTQHDERYVNAGNSAVEQPRFRQYMVDLIAGLAEDYTVDGIHLDYLRVGTLCFNDELLDYPGTAFDYPGCQADYRAWTRETYGREYTLWQDTDGMKQIADGGSGRVAAWQVRSVSALAQAIHQGVKAVRPEALLSVASVRNVPWETPVEGQVAWQWLDAGWVDAVFPTLYLDSTEAIVDRMERLRAAVHDENKRDRIFAGLAAYDFDDPQGQDWSDPIVERANALLRMTPPGEALEPAAAGIALFRAEHLSPAALAALAEGAFHQPAVPYWGTEALTRSGP